MWKGASAGGGGLARFADIKGGHTEARGGFHTIVFQLKQCRRWYFYQELQVDIGVTMQGATAACLTNILRG